METIIETLLIRVDAGERIGTGHLMRCLALAQAWQDMGGKAIFVLGTQGNVLQQRLTSEGMEVINISVNIGSSADSSRSTEIAEKKGASWLVVDGYHFGTDYQKQIKDAGLKLLFIDDYGHADYYWADIVLNQNLHAKEELYKNRADYTKLLLGTKYVLLRREFLRWRGFKREIQDVARKVLVTLGGSDPDNVTLKVIQALNKVNVEGLEVVVVLGALNPNYETLKSEVKGTKLKVQFKRNVGDMSELMAWADMAITAGGTTCWELAFMGLPSIIVVLAENQINVANYLDSIGAFLKLGFHKEVSLKDIRDALESLLMNKEKRLNMAKLAQSFIDGHGVNRVLAKIRNETFITLRKATEDDCRMLWEWANDPVVRANSFNPDPIPWESHVEWFKGKIDNPSCLIYIAINEEGIPVGQIRFDKLNEGEAEIDISVDGKYRGLGYGTLILRKSVDEVFKRTSIKRLYAYVKSENVSSKRIFEKAKFKKIGKKTLKGTEVEVYVREVVMKSEYYENKNDDLDSLYIEEYLLREQKLRSYPYEL